MNTGVMLDLIEPPYTEPYVRWCERAIYFALLDCPKSEQIGDEAVQFMGQWCSILNKLR